MFQLKKGFRFSTVQAGLALTLAAVLSACSEQPVPSEIRPEQVAATAGGEHDQADLPVVTITASRAVPESGG